MPTAKINKRSVDAFNADGQSQAVPWDSEIRGFGVRALPSGLKTFIVQYRNAEGIKRRINLGRYGVITVERARDLAKIKLGEVASGEDPARHVDRVPDGTLGPFHCLECNEALLYRQSRRARTHFAHRPDTKCTGETALHLYAKALLAAAEARADLHRKLEEAVFASTTDRQWAELFVKSWQGKCDSPAQLKDILARLKKSRR